MGSKQEKMHKSELFVRSQIGFVSRWDNGQQVVDDDHLKAQKTFKNKLQFGFFNQFQGIFIFFFAVLCEVKKLTFSAC